MKSHTPKGKCKSKSVSTNVSVNVYMSNRISDRVCDQKHDLKAWRSVRTSAIPFSDPLESTSSDSKSFDEDDMFGSDSDVETISLKPSLEGCEQSSNEHLVCTFINHTYHKQFID